MKHQKDIQCPVKQRTVYPFDVSYSALLQWVLYRNQCGFGVIAAAAAAQTS